MLRARLPSPGVASRVITSFSRPSTNAFGRRAASNTTKNAISATTTASPTPTPDDNNNDDKPEPPSVSKLQAVTNRAIEVAPGILAAGVVMQGGFMLAGQLGAGLLTMQGIEGVHASPVSGISIAILLGLGIGNAVPGGLPTLLKPGLSFASKPLLQMGIICVGAKLSALDLFSTGLAGVPAVVACVTVGMTFVPYLARKMELPSKMGKLIAAGTSICGVTAITAVAPAINASQKDASFAIANVVAFGTIGMLCYPVLAHNIFANSTEAGMFLGLAVHDTSQVIGSALSYSALYSDTEVLKVAAVTKLTRNLCLAGVVPALTYMQAKEDGLLKPADDSKEGLGALQAKLSEAVQYVPGFVVGFIGMSALRSVGDYTLNAQGAALGLMDADQWSAVTSMVGGTVGSHYLLGTAMAAVGLTTSLSLLRGVGVKPFVVGLAGAAAVGTTGLVAIKSLAALGVVG